MKSDSVNSSTLLFQYHFSYSTSFVIFIWILESVHQFLQNAYQCFQWDYTKSVDQFGKKWSTTVSFQIHEHDTPLHTLRSVFLSAIFYSSQFTGLVHLLFSLSLSINILCIFKTIFNDIFNQSTFLFFDCSPQLEYKFH